MFGRRSLRARVQELEAEVDLRRRETWAARGDCGIATGEMETWRRRAIESADRVVDVELDLRDCRRQLAAYEREEARRAQLEAANESTYKVLLTRPALPRQRKARELEAAS